MHQVRRRIFEDGNSINKGKRNRTKRSGRETKRDCLNAKEGMEIEAAVGKGLGSRGHNAADWCRGHDSRRPWASLSVNSKYGENSGPAAE
jgi:hypothetical protein